MKYTWKGGFFMKPRPCVPICKPPAPCGESFLVHRILGMGKLCRRSCRYTFPLENIPCGMEAPFTLQHIAVQHSPMYDLLPCRMNGSVRLQVKIPVVLTLCGQCGRTFSLNTCLEEEVLLRLHCQDQDTCKAQPYIAASVHLACNGSPCSPCECSALLDVSIDAYLLAPCIMGAAHPSPRCDVRPWYPQPHCCK